MDYIVHVSRGSDNVATHSRSSTPLKTSGQFIRAARGLVHIAAALSYEFVEKPFLRLKDRHVGLVATRLTRRDNRADAILAHVR